MQLTGPQKKDRIQSEHRRMITKGGGVTLGPGIKGINGESKREICPSTVMASCHELSQNNSNFCTQSQTTQQTVNKDPLV